jgi:hypothetical protein
VGPPEMKIPTFGLVFFFWENLVKVDGMNPATLITTCTLRLECQVNNKTSIGTAFLYNFAIEVEVDGQKQFVGVPMLVTNNHVVSEAETLNTLITLCSEAQELTDAVISEDDVHQHFVISNLKSKVIPHPDPNVDVCIIPIADITNQLPSGKKMRHSFISAGFHLPQEEESFTRPIEPILMIGYPNGLWDEQNNRPITRQGLTASHPLQLWNKKRQFVIDAACFGGSSGSPVFLFEDGMYRSGQNSYGPGTRVRFLGILFAGPQVSQSGRFEQKEIPTSADIVPVIDGMMNLGFVAHANVLLDYIPILEPIVRNEVLKRSAN